MTIKRHFFFFECSRKKLVIAMNTLYVHPFLSEPSKRAQTHIWCRRTFTPVHLQAAHGQCQRKTKFRDKYFLNFLGFFFANLVSQNFVILTHRQTSLSMVLLLFFILHFQMSRKKIPGTFLHEICKIKTRKIRGKRR